MYIIPFRNDSLNDILHFKFTWKFPIPRFILTKQVWILFQQKDDHSLSTDELIQIFSPIVTSARVMGWQFSNSYISIQCDDGINLVFDEVILLN